MSRDRIVTTIGDLRDNDLVKGTDGRWHKIRVLPIQEKQLYRLVSSAGSVVASYDHQWVLYGHYDYSLSDAIDGEHTSSDILDRVELSTVEIYGDSQFIGWSIGVPDGPVVQSVEMLEPGSCRCIEVLNSDDNQFEVITDTGERLFTHNCSVRIACGRLGGIASQMALGNSLGTTISGDIPGAGIVSINGVLEHVQYYFTGGLDWLKDWYKSHGKNDMGYSSSELTDEELTLGDDDEELSLSADDQSFEFEDSQKTVINRKEQKFREV